MLLRIAMPDYVYLSPVQAEDKICCSVLPCLTMCTSLLSRLTMNCSILPFLTMCTSLLPRLTMCCSILHFLRQGTHRRWELFKMGPCLGKKLTAAEVKRFCKTSTRYWRTHRPDTCLPRAWEVDPVTTKQGRAARRRYVRAQKPRSLEDKYVAFRAATMSLVDLGL